MHHDLAVVLAAGKGKRMKSQRAKVLHEMGGRSMLGHVIATLNGLRGAPGANPGDMRGQTHAAVVVGVDGDTVGQEARRWAPECALHVQTEQNGTAHAVLAARPALDNARGSTVFVLFADTPLVRAETLQAMRAELDAGAQVVVLGFHSAAPTGYGRLLLSASGDVEAIREEKDASEAERLVTLCNSGVMAFRVPDLGALIDRIGNENAQGEYYLTDAVELARADGLTVRCVTCAEDEVMGVNSRVHLAQAEARYQQRMRHAAMVDGATLIAPETVWFSYDTVLGQDVVVEPNVVFGPGVTVDAGAVIRANCHLEGAHVRAGAQIGPFARLRPGADLGEGVRIGNFVEVKNVTMGAGAKANHLAYLGDGSVGVNANVGAGTIFCNYDGFQKHRTELGDGAFIGSNSALVAPVTIGPGAYIGSGSVITKDVPAGALALERNTQDIREQWATRFRERSERMKTRQSKT